MDFSLACIFMVWLQDYGGVLETFPVILVYFYEPVMLTGARKQLIETQ